MRLPHPRGAFEAYARAAREATSEPELGSVLDLLEGMAREHGRERELVSLYRDSAPDVLDSGHARCERWATKAKRSHPLRLHR